MEQKKFQGDLIAVHKSITSSGTVEREKLFSPADCTQTRDTALKFWTRDTRGNEEELFFSSQQHKINWNPVSKRMVETDTNNDSGSKLDKGNKRAGLSR